MTSPRMAAAGECRERATYPDVHLGSVILLALKELRCSIWWAATPSLQQLPRGEEVAEAKI